VNVRDLESFSTRRCRQRARMVIPARVSGNVRIVRSGAMILNLV